MNAAPDPSTAPRYDLPVRPRRNRHSAGLRAVLRETTVTPDDMILPVFLHEDPDDVPLQSMPGVTRWSLPGLIAEVGRCKSLGIRGVVLFPKIEEDLKSADGRECANPEGLVPRAIAAIKDAHPQMLVVTDVALDPYSSDGHDGILGLDRPGPERPDRGDADPPGPEPRGRRRRRHRTQRHDGRPDRCDP